MSIILGIIFTLNMGISNLAVSFAPAYGSGIVNFKRAVLLFSLFFIAGAFFLGGRVSTTIGVKLLNNNRIDNLAQIILLTSALVTIFLANIFNVPQSTSIITVASVLGTALFYGFLNIWIFIKIIIIWIVLSALSYILVYLILKRVYPPTSNNMKIYEKLVANRKKMRKFTLIINCYNAFSLGTNNIANVVGPLVAAGMVSIKVGTLIFAPLFGVGALLFGKKLIRRTAKEIVPIGDFTGLIISFVSSTMTFMSSLLGVPGPYAQYSMFSILGVHSRKHSISETINHSYVKKMFTIWVVTPLMAFSLSYMLNLLFRRIL